jgi:hypothetical protein
MRAEMPMPQVNRDDEAKVASAAPVAPAAAESANAAQGASGDAGSDSSKSPDIWRALDAANFKPTASEAPQPSSSVASPAMADATQDAKQDAKQDTKNESDSAAAVAPAPAAAPAFAPPPLSVVPQVAARDVPAMGKATSLSALFLAAFGALVVVTFAAALAYFFTDRTRSREADGDGLSLAQDWPPEPFRLPSSLKLLAHGSFVDESVPVPGRPRWADVPRTSAPPSEPRDSDDVHQIEQLLTRAVRRSETLRGRMDGLTSPGSA